MFKNDLTVAVRSFWRQKTYSLINVLGLAVGLACAILILQYVHFELAFDRHSALANRTYRVLRETRRTDGPSSYSNGLSGLLKDALEEEVPEVVTAVRRWGHGGVTIGWGETRLQGSIAVVDPGYFAVFDLDLENGGDPLTALGQPGTILIKKDRVSKYFGDVDPVGKTVTVHDVIAKGTYVVAGVIEANPSNTTVHWSEFVTTHYPDEEYPKQHWNRWLPGTWRMTGIYVVLRENALISDVEGKLASIMAKHLGPEVARVDRYRLQKLTRTRLYSTADFGMPSPRRIEHIYALLTTAGLLLLVACVNFINLTTARATRRAREIGVRKMTGAGRGQLIRQFLSESWLMSLMGLVIAVVLTKLALPTVNGFVNADLTIDNETFLLGIGLSLVVGVVAGLYPALVLSSFGPVVAYRMGSAGVGGGWVRRTLVVFQFAVSILLISGTLTVYAQLDYIEGQNLGYDDEGIISLPFFSRGVSRREQLQVKDAFTGHPNVLGVSLASGRNFQNPSRVTIKRTDKENELSVYQIQADGGFLDIFRIPLLEGRNFRERDLRVDLRRNGPDEFILNRAAVRALGFPDDESPIGHPVQVYGGDQKRLYKRDKLEGTIVGVVPDFHFQSLHEPVKPLMINPHYWVWHVLLRVRGDRLTETLSFCEETWYRFAPDIVFRHSFQDERTKNAYQAERQTATLSIVVAGLAVFVGCMGLLGLAAFAAERRSKEIGIRKVLGATVASVLGLLSSEFLRLFIVANVIAWPLAYVMARAWLDSFAYRIDLGLLIFAQGGMIVGVLALTTVFAQTIRAATSDPVDVLRTE